MSTHFFVFRHKDYLVQWRLQKNFEYLIIDYILSKIQVIIS